MTQHERIASFLDHYGSISPYEAFQSLGITKLATRIGEMKRKGYPVMQNMVTETNRWGEKVSYMRYYKVVG